MEGRSRSSNKGLRNDDGVVAIEFALVLPFILLFVFVITDFGRLFNYLNDANQIAANGARLAAVNNYPGGNTLRSDQGDTQEIRNASGGTHLPGGMTVCVTFPSGTNAVGDPVTVKAKGTFKLVPLFAKFGIPTDIPINGQSTQRLERAPSFSADAGC